VLNVEIGFVVIALKRALMQYKVELFWCSPSLPDFGFSAKRPGHLDMQQYEENPFLFRKMSRATLLAN